MFHETFYQKCDDGTRFVDALKKQGIIPGIKPGQKRYRRWQHIWLKNHTSECDAFEWHVCAQVRKKDGAQFAKWRCVHKISYNTPSHMALVEIASVLARYASICQQNGLVPIVEPEILPDGPHDLDTCRRTTEIVLSYCYRALNDHHVYLEGTLLKPNMVTAGQNFDGPKPKPEDVALATVTALLRSVPPAVPGVVFLSGGQSEEDATLNLNAMNQYVIKIKCKKPWVLTFSYGRALQASCMAKWKGQDSNVKDAQAILLQRARANSMAALGKYTGDAECWRCRLKIPIRSQSCLLVLISINYERFSTYSTIIVYT
ncbi:fructose-bisphosphate aldolase class-I [Cooperia oncophora]